MNEPITRPPGFASATHALGALRRLALFCQRHDAAVVAAAIMEHEAADVARHVSIIDRWLAAFITRLGGTDVASR